MDRSNGRKMTRGARKPAGFAPAAVGDFLEAAYSVETDAQSWLAEVSDAALAVWGRGDATNGAIYDASHINAFRAQTVHIGGFSNEARDCIMRGIGLHTPAMVIRTYRSLAAGCMRNAALPEMLPMLEEMRSLGQSDAMIINGLDPSGFGAFMGLWTPVVVDPGHAELTIYRRMAHHLGAAHRCRRRLRESQPARSCCDATEGAEAVLDARKRVVHATGPALTKEARVDLIETAKIRDSARSSKTGADESLQRWLPLTRARWTLVDSFDRNGARYIVARENQTQVQGLASLSDRERQVVAYVAIGQSTKETAYALGISDATVRVLLARAATKLGVRSRTALLDHAEVRLLRPRSMLNTGAPGE